MVQQHQRWKSFYKLPKGFSNKIEKVLALKSTMVDMIELSGIPPKKERVNLMDYSVNDKKYKFKVIIQPLQFNMPFF